MRKRVVITNRKTGYRWLGRLRWLPGFDADRLREIAGTVD
jgi:hypothetical protein